MARYDDDHHQPNSSASAANSNCEWVCDDNFTWKIRKLHFLSISCRPLCADERWLTDHWLISFVKKLANSRACRIESGNRRQPASGMRGVRRTPPAAAIRFPFIFIGKGIDDGIGRTWVRAKNWWNESETCCEWIDFFLTSYFTVSTAGQMVELRFRSFGLYYYAGFQNNTTTISYQNDFGYLDSVSTTFIFSTFRPPLSRAFFRSRIKTL